MIIVNSNKGVEMEFVHRHNGHSFTIHKETENNYFVWLDGVRTGGFYGYQEAKKECMRIIDTILTKE